MMDTEQVLTSVLARLDRLEAYTGLQEATEGLPDRDPSLDSLIGPPVATCAFCGAGGKYLARLTGGSNDGKHWCLMCNAVEKARYV